MTSHTKNMNTIVLYSKILPPYFSERAFQIRLALTACLGDPLPVRAQ